VKKRKLVTLLETILIMLRQIAIMGIFMAIGWVLYRTKLISAQGTKELSNLLIRVILPAVIIQAFLVERTEETMIQLLISFGLALISLVLSTAIARVIFRKNHVIEHFGTAFSNVGFFGIPIVQALLGNGAVFFIASFVVLVNLFQWTYGVYLFTKNKKIFSPKKLLLNPTVLSFIIALILFFTQFQLPSILLSAVTMISPLNTPIAMIILGCYLATGKIAELFKDRGAYITAGLRLIVIPLITVALFSSLPQSLNPIRIAVLISASAPVGANVAVYAGLHDQDYSQAVRLVCLSTLFSVITIPLIVLLATWLWM
jgi:hypothetical protein